MSSFEEFLIGNLSVRFPYEPYDVQKAYMSRVLSCLQVDAYPNLRLRNLLRQ
jgi:hypothetical protein